MATKSIVFLDNIPEPMQPDTLTWEQPRRLGTTGNGKPVFGRYWSCKLAFSRMTSVQYERWYAAWEDGDEHTIKLPHPESGKMTDYTARVSDFNERMDIRDICKTAASGVDITLINIEVD